MPIPKEMIRARLIRKFGFVDVEGSKHEALTLYIDGHKVATTRFSRSHQEISDKILSIIARELWVQSKDLRQMCECTKSRDDYLQHLEATGKTGI